MIDNQIQYGAFTLKRSAIIAGTAMLLMAIIAPIADMAILQKLFLQNQGLSVHPQDERAFILQELSGI